jgi:hypothetical protein
MTGFTNASKISQCIKQIGNVTINTVEDKVEYLFNSKPIDEVTDEYYTDLFNNFKILLYTQLKEKCDKPLLKKYLGEAKITLSSINNLITNLRPRGDQGIDSNENKNVDVIIDRLFIIKSIFDEINLIIEDEIEYFDYRISSDYELILNSFTPIDKNYEYGIEGKLIFNLSKKDSLMFLYILEQTELLKFEGEEQRRKFIEGNFCFTEVRNNADNGKAFPMIGTSSEISNFKSRVDAMSNNKTLEKLLEKLNKTIHLFEFKS